MVRFWLQFGDREIALPDGELLVGRGEGCHVRLTAPSVSRRHLRIVTVGDSVVAFDLDSRNGTWVNDERLAGPVKLNGGDVVMVGTQHFAIREAPLIEDEADEAEPSTCDLVVEKRFQPRPGREPTGRQSWARHTIELDRTDFLAHGAKGEPGDVSVGAQICAVCGNSIEIGVPSCPYCSSEPYSTPRYRTCLGCTALLSEDDESCPKCGLARPAAGVGRSDRRRESRTSTAMAGLYVSSSLTFEAEIANLSHGGLFITAELLDPVGTPADIILSTPDNHRARFSGEVAHVVDGPHHPSGLQPGMGIRFVDVTPTSRAWLESFLARRGLDGSATE